MDSLHFGWIHGDARLGDDVAKVGDGGYPKSALGTLDEEPVLLQREEDSAKVPKVVCP